MAAAASGGGSAAAPSCPTDFSRFELYAPRASIGPFGQVCRAVGLVESNVLSNDRALNRLGYEKVFGRYYHLFQKWVDHAEKHRTSENILKVFKEKIEPVRKLVFENYRAKRDNPRDTPTKIDFADAMAAASRIRDENPGLSSELVRFVYFLELMYMREMRELGRRISTMRRNIGPVVPTGAINTGPLLEERLAALRTRKRARKNSRKTRRRTCRN